MKAYGAVVYVKSENETGENYINKRTAKSRVAPIKTITLPPLELRAAVLLVELTKKILDVLNLSVLFFLIQTPQ